MRAPFTLLLLAQVAFADEVTEYAALVRRIVKPDGVDYAALQPARPTLDACAARPAQTLAERIHRFNA